jgi:hypothetical protein
MDQETLELLKRDLVYMQTGHRCQNEMEAIATRVIDTIWDIAKNAAEKEVSEHGCSYLHETGEDY